MSYTKEEIKVFEDKDLRISKQAILKSLIERLDLEDIYEVNKVTDLTEKYIDYIYRERKLDTSNEGDASVEIRWEEIAEGLNLAIPDGQNIKILNLIVDKYIKLPNKVSANPKDILTHIIETYGKYPTNPESVSKVVSSLTN